MFCFIIWFGHQSIPWLINCKLCSGTESNHNKFLSYMDIIFCHPLFLYLTLFFPSCLSIWSKLMLITYILNIVDIKGTEFLLKKSIYHQMENWKTFSHIIPLWIHCTVREGVKRISGLCAACTYFSNNCDVCWIFGLGCF